MDQLCDSDDEYWVGNCPICNAKDQIIRPGKAQPNCECHLKCCFCGETREYFGIKEHPDYPHVSGCYCRKCGP